MSARLRLLGLVLASTVALTGCLAVPDQGPVVEVGGSSDVRAGEAPDIVPAPPQPGESASDIVRHFLEAMRASPVETSVARKFLTKDAAASWRPEEQTITYVSTSGPIGSSQLRVRLLGATGYDSRGTYLGALRPRDRTLHFPMQLVDGEWRIAEAPNALIVNDDWFDQRFQRVSLYFFDPSGKHLIPEPVFLTRGDQLPTALTKGLLAGPPSTLRRVERTFVPSGTTLDLSVPPVSGGGVADIALSSGGGRVSPEATELMMAQLTWTLRQVPSVEALRVTVDGQRVDLPGAEKTVPVDSFSEYDPTGWLASSTPYAVRKGVVVGDALSDPLPVAGPFGTKKYGLRSIAVDPANTKIAGVSSNGESVLVTSLTNADARVAEVASGATNLLPPVWDLSGRLWLVDRRPSGAVVIVLADGTHPQEISAPGITGRQVRRFEVSRDGSRFVAVVSGRSGDNLVVSRVQRSADGRLSLAPPTQMPSPSDTPLRARDLGWSDATTATVLNPLTDDLTQVSAVPLDRSPGRSVGTVPGGMRWLVSSPIEVEPTYVVARDEVVLLADVGSVKVAEGIALPTLTYAG